MSASEKPGDLVEVGRIFKPRGVRGEVFVSPEREGYYPFSEGGRVFLASPGGTVPVSVERFFMHKGHGVVKLGVFGTFEEASAASGAALLLPASEVEDAPDAFDIPGLKGKAVVDASRGAVGEATGARRGPAYWYIEARGSRGDFEFPAVAGLGVEIPAGESVVRVDLPRPWPGLDEREGETAGAAGGPDAKGGDGAG